MNMIYKLLCALLAAACVMIYTSRSDRITELETERDIYQSRVENNTAEIPMPKTPVLTPSNEPISCTYAGEFDVTANCCEAGCSMCGGTGITASGMPQTPGITAGANFDTLPAGTWIYIEDVGIRQVQDTGPNCPAMHIDVAVPTHAEALAWPGYGMHRVWILEGSNHD